MIRFGLIGSWTRHHNEVENIRPAELEVVPEPLTRSPIEAIHDGMLPIADTTCSVGPTTGSLTSTVLVKSDFDSGAGGAAPTCGGAWAGRPGAVAPLARAGTGLAATAVATGRGAGTGTAGGADGFAAAKR